MTIKILKKYNIKAKKSLGQNFLVDENILDEIGSSLDIKDKNIIEVGPGYGALTEKLLKNYPKSLTLLELDKDMIDILQMRLKNEELDTSKTTLIIKNIDVLEYDSDFDDYYLIANIPYYITSPILRHFLYQVKYLPKKMLILMQKDVGDKILGKGKNKSSVLSLYIEKKCDVKEIISVPNKSFIPAPKIESSVLLFDINEKYGSINDNDFLEIIKKGFKEPRKKLIKNLSNSGYNKDDLLKIFNELNIDENIRGEDLDIKTWCKIVESLKK